MLNIARIENGIVKNIEVADQEWFNLQENNDEVYFVVVTDEKIPWVGYPYNKQTNEFERPPGCSNFDTNATDPEVDAVFDGG